MEESKKKDKIRVYDQWFYQVEDEEKQVYNTEGKEKPKKKNYMKLIIDKNMAIIEWWRGKQNTSKLMINKKNNTCIYQEYLPETIYMEKIPKGDILINYIETQEDSKIPGNFTFHWKPHQKKRKSQRKHLKEDLEANIDTVESKQKEYVEELIKHLKVHLDILGSVQEEKEEKKEIKSNIITPKTRIIPTNLNIPSSIYLVDREYKFIKCEPDYYAYAYQDKDSARVAEIRDLGNKYQLDITIDSFKDNNHPRRYALSIGYNNKNCLVSKFETVGKGNIVVDTPTKTYFDERGRTSTQLQLKDVRFCKKSIYKYNDDQEKYDIISNVKIKAGDNQYILKSINSRYFLDKNDLSHYLSGSEYGMLDQISMLSQGIYNNIEETFSKVKQK